MVLSDQSHRCDIEGDCNHRWSCGKWEKRRHASIVWHLLKMLLHTISNSNAPISMTPRHSNTGNVINFNQIQHVNYSYIYQKEIFLFFLRIGTFLFLESSIKTCCKFLIIRKDCFVMWTYNFSLLHRWIFGKLLWCSGRQMSDLMEFYRATLDLRAQVWLNILELSGDKNMFVWSRVQAQKLILHT